MTINVPSNACFIDSLTRKIKSEFERSNIGCGLSRIINTISPAIVFLSPSSPSPSNVILVPE